MLSIKFTFDNKSWVVSDVSNERIEDLNKCLWILLHILKAKEVRFEMLEEDLK